MLEQLCFLMGQSLAQQENLLNAVTRIETRQLTIERKVDVTERQVRETRRRVRTLEQAKPDVSNAEKVVKVLTTYLLPLVMTVLGLWLSKGDLTQALEFGRIFGPR